MAQIDFGLQPQQVVEHARGNVTHIGRPFTQIIVVDRGQRRGITFGDGVEGIFGDSLGFLEGAHDLVQQRAIFQHQQMRVKDTPFL
jgi:hypothetical protein